MKSIVDAGLRQSIDLGRRFLTGAAALPGVSSTMSAGLGLLAAGTGHLLFDGACRGLGDDEGLPAQNTPSIRRAAAH